MLCKHIMLKAPKLFGEINVVIVRIAESLYLVPHAVDLILTVSLYLCKSGPFINKLSVLKDRNEKLGSGIAIKGLSLPSSRGIKYFKRFRLVDNLIINANKIRLRLSAFFIAYAVNLFKVRRGYLSNVFADLYFWNNVSV